MTEQVTTQVLRLEVDKGSAKQAIDTTERLAREIADLRGDVRDFARQMGITDKEMANYTKTAKAAARDTKLGAKLDKENRSLRQQTKELRDAEKAAQAFVRAQRDQAGLFGDVESRTRALTGAVGFVGGQTGQKIEQSVNVGAEVLASVEAVKLLKLELPQLTTNLGLSRYSTGQLAAGLGIATAAIAAVVIATDHLTDAAERARREQEAFIDTQEQLSSLNISSLTTKQIEDEIDALEKLNREREREREVIRQRQNEIVQSFNTGELIQEGLSQTPLIGTLFSGLEQGLAPIEERYKELTDQIVASDGVIDELRNSLSQTATAANDLKAATDEWRAGIEDRIDAELNAELQRMALTREANSLSIDQLQQRLALEKANAVVFYKFAEIATENMNFEQQDRYLAAVAESERRIAAFQDALTLKEAQTQLDTFVSNVSGLVGSGADQMTASFEGVSASLEDASSRAAEFAAQQSEVNAKRALDATREQEDFLRQRNYDLADHYADQAKLDQEFYTDRGQVLNDALDDLSGIEQERADEVRSLNDDLQSLARDHSDAMRKIARDSNRDIQSAASRLDAVALREAQLRQQDAIEDENAQYNKERDEREAQFQERLDLLDRERREVLDAQREELRALEDKHAQERASNEAAFREELRREDIERGIKLQRQQQDFAIEDAARRAHFGVITSETQAHYNNLLTIQRNAQSQMQSIAAQAPTRSTATSTTAARTVAPVVQSAAQYPQAATVAPSTSYVTSTNSRSLARVDQVNINVSTQGTTTDQAKQIASIARQEIYKMLA